jgi:Tfp pilus assembly protein PilN
MMFSDTSLGIDFRQNHLILTLLKRSFWNLRLVDEEISPLPSEEQKEERETQAISRINTFISRNRLNRERVSVSIPREKVFVRFIRLPAATKENLRKVLDFETPKYSPFEKGETIFDYCLLKEDKEWLFLFVVFVKKSEVDSYLSLLKKIGIAPISIQIPSTAALNLFLHQNPVGEKEAAVLLDVNEPFFEMNILQGTDWKESFYLALPQEGKESVILDTYERSEMKGDFPSKPTFFVYGLDASENVLPSLRNSDQIKTALPPPLSRIEIEKGLSRPDKIFSSIGVPLKGLIQPKFDLNLLPFEMRKKVRQIGKPLVMVFSSLALLLCLSWGLGIFLYYKNSLDSINAEIKRRKPEIEALDKLRKQRDTLGKEIEELDKIRSSEISKVEILEELSKILPNTVWIWNFKYNGKEIEISGFADSASDLIPLLEKSPLFEKVAFGAQVTKEKQMMPQGEKEKERFKIKMLPEARRVTP